MLATAHDMAREHRVMSALAATTVPVPEMVALCEDLAVMGVPFYVMQYVEGAVLRRTAQSADLTDDQRADIAHRLVDTLADLHAVDPATVGLSDFGHPEGFLERQVRRWSAQLERSRTREVPGFPELAAALAARVPRSQRASIVHGDYRLDNVLIGEGPADPRRARLGDGHAGRPAVRPRPAAGLRDPRGRRGRGRLGRHGPAQRLPLDGRPGRALRRPHRPGRHPPPWYIALGYYKLAVICEGIHARHLAGQTVGPGFDRIGELVPPLVAAGSAALG